MSIEKHPEEESWLQRMLADDPVALEIAVTGPGYSDGIAGKTSLINAFLGKETPVTSNTTSTEATICKLELDPGSVERVRLWEFLGISRGRRNPVYALKHFFEKVDVILFCVSPDSSSQMRSSIKRYHDHSMGTPMIVVGTKSDMQKEGFEAELEMLQSSINGICFMTCSAVTKQGVREVLAKALEVGLAYRKSKTSPRQLSVKDSDIPNIVKDSESSCMIQ